MDEQDPAFDADARQTVLQEQGSGGSGLAGRLRSILGTNDRAVAGSEITEETRLLDDSTPADNEAVYFGDKDFAGLPWYNRPSIWWVLPPFFLVTMAFGGILPPKINLMQEMICREYYKEQALLHPGFAMTPVEPGADNDQCRTSEISAKTANFTLAVGLITGILSALVAPHLGALSDRYGRKLLLVVTSIGTVCSEIISIFAATNPETFPLQWFYLGSALDGLSGTFTVAIAIANAYATDCTPPARRNVSFAMFHAALFTGLAVGPFLAGRVVAYTGNLASIFWVLLGVHLFFVVFITVAVPESLAKKRQIAARERHTVETEQRRAASNNSLFWRIAQYANLYAPLQIFWPTGPGSSPKLRRNLIALAAVDTIAFGVAMGTYSIIIIYTRYVFGWKTPESSTFMSIVNGSRVISLIVILPILVRLFRGRKAARERQTSGSDLFDLSIIRLAIFFDTLGFVGYTMARSGTVLYFCGAVAAIGGIGSPTLQSAMTNHVPADRTGQLLGAVGLLHALARVVAPIIFTSIYTATVAGYPQAVFLSLTITFGLAFVISWFIRPHVHWDKVDDDNDEHES